METVVILIISSCVGINIFLGAKLGSAINYATAAFCFCILVSVLLGK
jgi:hypothetical protein